MPDDRAEPFPITACFHVSDGSGKERDGRRLCLDLGCRLDGPRIFVFAAFDLIAPAATDAVGYFSVSSASASVNIDSEVGAPDAVVGRLARTRRFEFEGHGKAS
jgi:hypothetical protein